MKHQDLFFSGLKGDTEGIFYFDSFYIFVQ